MPDIVVYLNETIITEPTVCAYLESLQIASNESRTPHQERKMYIRGEQQNAPKLYCHAMHPTMEL